MKLHIPSIDELEYRRKLIADDIPKDRVNADEPFKKIGFVRTGDCMVEMTKEQFDIKQISDSIAPCGLVCRLCHLADSCDSCRSENNCCGKLNWVL